MTHTAPGSTSDAGPGADQGARPEWGLLMSDPTPAAKSPRAQRLGAWAMRPWRLARGVVPVLAGAALLVACASIEPPAAGTSADELRGSWGEPTGRYTLADGSTRLEYATGPFGRTTWMVDLDEQQRVRSARQVLDEASFDRFQRLETAQTRETVLQTLGRPGERYRLGWLGGEVWSWRYPTYDCLWFQVSFDREGRMTGSGYGTDPACDVPGDWD
jgi:hypothetical protein